MSGPGAVARACGYVVLTFALYLTAAVHGAWNQGCNDIGGPGDHCSREHPHAYVLAPVVIALVVVLTIVVVEHWLYRRRQQP